MPTEEKMNIDERYSYLHRMQRRYEQAGRPPAGPTAAAQGFSPLARHGRGFFSGQGKGLRG